MICSKSHKSETWRHWNTRTNEEHRALRRMLLSVENLPEHTSKATSQKERRVLRLVSFVLWQAYWKLIFANANVFGQLTQLWETRLDLYGCHILTPITRKRVSTVTFSSPSPYASPFSFRTPQPSACLTWWRLCHSDFSISAWHTVHSTNVT